MRLHQIVADGLPSDFPPLRALEYPPTSLPGGWPPPTVLFGREVDLEALARLVNEHGNRLVTLVGAGGVGKTRLAIEASGARRGGLRRRCALRPARGGFRASRSRTRR